MKLQKISNVCLKAMVKAYSKSQRQIFDMDFFINLLSDVSEDDINNALYTLDDDGLVSVFSADGIAYSVSLIPDGIRNYQENTALKRGIECIKEIKALIK